MFNLLIGIGILILIFGAVGYSIRKEFENEGGDNHELKAKYDSFEDEVFFAKDYGIYTEEV